MRIAFYAPLKPPDHPVASGDRAMGRALISALQLAGHDVFVASRLRSYDAGHPSRQQRICDLGRRMADRFVHRIEAVGRRPDVWFTYHLYHKAPDWLGPGVADGLAIPYIVAEASYAPKQKDGLWALGHAAVAEALRRADLVLQPNPADAECVLPLLRSPDRLVPLKPFLDTTPFRGSPPQADRARLAATLAVSPAEPWLLAVAMMRPDQKLQSYRILADALSEVADLPWLLVVAGRGPSEPEVRAAFSPHSERVRWIGMLDRPALIALYRAADLFVWPAVKEAWGMALLEAQAAGLPVVAGRSGGVASIVADCETGLLPPQGDAPAFAAAVRSLLLDPERRQEMGRAAASRIARDHDMDVAAAFLDQRLRKLTGCS